MAAERFTDPPRATDSNGDPLSGAGWYFYTTETLIPLSVYTTADLDVAHDHPVVADAGGLFPPIYYDNDVLYRGILKDEDGATIKDIDPINTTASGLAVTTRRNASATLLTQTTWNNRHLPAPQDYGVSSSSSDLTAAIATIQTAEPGVGGIYFPHPSDHYELSGPFVMESDSAYVGESQGGVLLYNVADSATFWENTVAFGGTYMGHGAADGATAETSYGFTATAAGVREVTLEDAGAGTNFEVGDIVFLEDANDFASAAYAKAASVNEVLAIATDTLTLKYVLRDAYTANGGTNPTIRRETGDLTTTNPGASTACRMLKRATVRDLHFKSLRDYGCQAFHIAAWESLFENIRIEASGGMGVNPCAQSVFRDIAIEYDRKGFELAYFHSDVQINNLWLRRRAPLTGANVGDLTFGLQISETGQDVFVNGLHIDNFGWASSGGYASVGVSARRTFIDGGHVSGSPGAGVSIIAERGNGSSVHNMSIRNHSRQAIIIGGDDCSVENNKIGPTNTGYGSIILSAGSVNNRVVDNSLGDPTSPGQPDAIIVEDGHTHTHTIRQNRSQLSVKPVDDYTLTTHTGTLTETTLYTYTLPALVKRPKQFALKFEARGNINNSGSGVKTLRLKANGTTMMTFATTTGGFQGGLLVQGAIIKRAGTNTLSFMANCQYDTTAQAPELGVPSIDPQTADIVLTLTAELAHVDDSITIREWRVNMEDDQIRDSV